MFKFNVFITHMISMDANNEILKQVTRYTETEEDRQMAINEFKSYWQKHGADSIMICLGVFSSVSVFKSVWEEVSHEIVLPPNKSNTGAEL